MVGLGRGRGERVLGTLSPAGQALKLGAASFSALQLPCTGRARSADLDGEGVLLLDMLDHGPKAMCLGLPCSELTGTLPGLTAPDRVLGWFILDESWDGTE